MGKRKNIRKRIEGLKRAVEEHEKKIEQYAGRNPHLIPYWRAEIERIEERKELEKSKLGEKQKDSEDKKEEESNNSEEE